MKKIIGTVLILFLLISTSFAYTEHNIQSANFIAKKGIINDNSLRVLEYNLDFKITRREMLKVMMNLSGKSVSDSCLGDFSDMDSSDWGCKYAEAALNNGFIAANTNFRPSDNVTQIEALKMIMQANSLARDPNDDWRAGYVSKALREEVIDDEYLDYDTNAVRGWIFSSSARTFSDFRYVSPDVQLTPEEEELFNTLFDL